MEQLYRLRRYVGGLPHVADVAVRVEPFERDDVVVSDGVFDWRRDEYGPDAVVHLPSDPPVVAEAVEGVRYVLARTRGDGGRLVTVTMNFEMITDTGPGDVKFAAAGATCLALEVELDRPPYIEASGVVFPD